MKRLSKTLIALLIALLMATLLPVQVIADTPDYISEIKVGVGKDAKEAKASLNGFTILDCDLNQNAGGGSFSKGERAVYMGYKTTKDSKDAITDLALMNMKGGYSPEDYEILMEKQMKEQIVPFVTDFLQCLTEYRQNYNSKNKNNKQRAVYIHDLLNKLTDDDCGGAGLGDLLLNETKFEMGDDVYNALSDDEKNEHADILTIVSQSNGQATVLIYNLISMACDTKNNTWIDRFINTTYDDLINSTGKSPTDARKELAKKYDNDAQIIVDSWDSLRDDLLKYDEAKSKVDKFESYDYDAFDEKYEDFDIETAEPNEIVDAMVDMTEERAKTVEASEAFSTVAIKEYLDTFAYEDGTLLDFFIKSSDEIKEDITVLYPLVASLSAGQRVCLEYVTLRELILQTQMDFKNYKNSELEKSEPTSVYSGVDRTIYEKNCVALTSDSLRKKALEQQEETVPGLSTFTGIMIGITALSVVGFVGTIIARKYVIVNSIAKNTSKIAELNKIINTNSVKMEKLSSICTNMKNIGTLKQFGDVSEVIPANVDAAAAEYQGLRTVNETSQRTINTLKQEMVATRSTMNRIMAGVTVAMVVITAVSIVLTFRDMAAKYKVDLTPIPKYMVDEKDLIGYNSKGEKIVLKNQSAYYSAVECNRSEDAEFYKTLNVYNDLNGDVGQQWLTLYSVKNEMEDPILASSLKAEVNNNDVPAGYTTGIHMFGSDSAFNLNSYPYVWNKTAPKIQVYFKRDTGAKKANMTGSNFSAGVLALTGGGGIVIGAALSAFCMTSKKRKDNKTVTA